MVTPNTPGSDPGLDPILARLAALDRRLSALDRRLSALEAHKGFEAAAAAKTAAGPAALQATTGPAAPHAEAAIAPPFEPAADRAAEPAAGPATAHAASPAPAQAAAPAHAPASEPAPSPGTAAPGPRPAWLAAAEAPPAGRRPSAATIPEQPAPPVGGVQAAPGRPWPPAPVGPARGAGVVPPGTGVPEPSPLSFREIEARMTGRALAWAGGAALIIGVVFLLSLAFSRGWITNEARVALGLVGGSIAIGIAAWCFGRTQPLLGTVLSAVGLGTLSLALYAATRLYGFVAPEVALAGSFAAAVVAAGIAIRYDTQVVAAFGLIAVVAAPPVLGAPGNLVTMAFLGTALAGTTIIALFRSWPWLPRLAFVLSAPQVLWWVAGEPPPAVGLGVVVLGSYWALNAAAATGAELAPTRTTLGRPSASLLVFNALFAVLAGAVLLRRETADLAAAMLGLLGVAHLLLAGYLFRLRGDHYPFGLLAGGIGLAAVVAAVPVAYEGPRVPLLWTALAVALAVPYARRRHGWAGAAGIAIAGLAVLHLVTIEAPFEEWALGGTTIAGTPFVSEIGLTLAGLLTGALVAGWIVHDLRVRAGLLVASTLVLAYVLPYELAGLALVVGWLAISLALLGGQRVLEDRLGRPALGVWIGDAPTTWLAGPAVIGIVLAIGNLVVLQLPLDTLAAIELPATPFVDQATVYAAVIVAALLGAAIITVEPVLRAAAIVSATAVAAYLVAFELGATASVVAWCGLAALQAVAIRLDPAGRVAYLATGAVLVGIAAARTLLQVAPPARLSVEAAGLAGHPLFVSEASLALGALAAILAAAAWLLRGSGVSAWLGLAAGGVVVYLLSIGVVDVFASQVGGAVALEELQRQAQVALSILWAAVGFGTFAVGAVRGIALAREFGLALLALATVKVFVFDLSFLDVAYRVLSFIGLGLLLLAGAFVYQTHRPRPGGQGRPA